MKEPERREFPAVHFLKCDKQHVDRLIMGHKRMELRFNDRDFRPGDVLVIGDRVDASTSRPVALLITHVFLGENDAAHAEEALIPNSGQPALAVLEGWAILSVMKLPITGRPT